MPRKKKTTEPNLVATTVSTLDIESAMRNVGVKIGNFETNMPPLLIERNSAGLLTHIDYKYQDNRKIDWRAMVNEHFLVPNKQNFEKRQQPVPATTEGLEDKDLLILLAGFKELADIRGYKSVDYEIVTANENEVTMKCVIEFIPNYETEGRAIRFASTASANVLNTNGFGKIFLCPIAENRAFVRCVRNFLRILVIGSDEISPVVPEEAPPRLSTAIDPLNLLKNKLSNVNWDSFKNMIVKTGRFDGAAEWGTVNDIPKANVYECISLLDKALKKKSAAQS